MAVFAIIGGQVGFRLRGDLDAALVKSYDAVVQACKAHLQDEKDLKEQQDFYKNFRSKNGKRITFT